MANHEYITKDGRLIRRHYNGTNTPKITIEEIESGYDGNLAFHAINKIHEEVVLPKMGKMIATTFMNGVFFKNSAWIDRLRVYIDEAGDELPQEIKIVENKIFFCGMVVE